MSIPRELRERFQKKIDPTPTREIRANVSDLLGIALKDIHEIVVADISKMIEQGYRKPLEGYILCLSRIISHKTAWECVTEAFHKKNEKVPSKYFSQFGQTFDNPAPKKGIVASP